jgi:hypothetical protein
MAGSSFSIDRAVRTSLRIASRKVSWSPTISVSAIARSFRRIEEGVRHLTSPSSNWAVCFFEVYSTGNTAWYHRGMHHMRFRGIPGTHDPSI